MRPLRYSINVTLDGCCHHEAGLPPDEDSMRYWTAEMARPDALLFGRVTYEMMESAWRKPASGEWPDWIEGWQLPFAETIDSAKKYVVSSTLGEVDWNAELLRGDLLLAGLRERIELELVDRQELRSGAVAMRYRPRRGVA